MLKCPNCMEPIPKLLSAKGGTCPRCAELILPFGNDFELEASDTEERLPMTEEVEKTELEILNFNDEELEATELIYKQPLRPPHGTLFDKDYQEDFPDDDFFDQEAVLPQVRPQKRGSSLSLIIVLVVVIAVLS